MKPLLRKKNALVKRKQVNVVKAVDSAGKVGYN